MNQQRCSERHEVWGAAPVPSQSEEVDVTVLAPFPPEVQERLIRLRREVARGERSDSLPIDKRQDFVRWLIAQGRLSDNSDN